MRIKKLTVRNYKSIGNAPVEFTFENGLNLFKGSPGEGKSLVMSAVSFALYGKNVDEKGNSKATIPTSKLVNDINKKELETIIELDNGYTITRGIKPNVFKIEKDGVDLADASAKKIDDDYVVKYCLEGLTLKEFLKTAFLSDRVSSSPFLYMSKTERKNYIEDILSLRRIPILADHLKTHINENELEKNRLDTEKTLLENTIKNEEENIQNQVRKKEETDKLIEEFHSNRETRIKDIQKEIEDSKDSIEPKKDTLKENNKKSLEDLESKYLIDKDNLEKEYNQSIEDSHVEYEDNKQSKTEELDIKLNEYKSTVKEEKVQIDIDLEKFNNEKQDLIFKRDLLEKDIEVAQESKKDIDQDKLDKINEDVSKCDLALDNIKTEMTKHKAKKEAWEESEDGTTTCDHCGKETSIKAPFDLEAHNQYSSDMKEEFLKQTNLKKELLEEKKIIDLDIEQNKEFDEKANSCINEFGSLKLQIKNLEDNITSLEDKKANFNTTVQDKISSIKESNKKDLETIDSNYNSTRKRFEEIHSSKSNSLKENYEKSLEQLKENLEKSLSDVDNQSEQFISHKESMIQSINNEVEPLPIEVNHDYLNKLKEDYKTLSVNLDTEYNNSVELKTMKDVILDKAHKKKALESYLPLFEKRLNDLLERFFEEMEFSLKAELTDDFEMTFRKNGKEISVFELSSGQKQLVTLATTFSFLYLLQIKHKTRLNILLIDEILDVSLGNQVGNVIEYLSELAKDSSVNIISHNTTLPLHLFSSITNVAKEGSFSTYTKE